MTTVQAPPAATTPDQPARRTSWLTIAIAVLVLGSIVIRFSVTSPLWLDESQTVAIAHRSLSGLFAALRVDGSPPLFYLALHFWIDAFGTSTIAVRSLAGVFSLACLPAAYLAARSLGMPRDLRWAAVVLFATSPFAAYYGTEARMYSLLLLLTLLAVMAYERVWRQGAAWQILAAALVTSAMLLTHYWTLFFYAAGGLLALVLAIRGSRPARRVVIALVLAAIPFAPWAPTFVFQTLHTGAPWGTPAGLDTVLLLPLSWGGAGLTGKFLAGAFYVLILLALCGTVRDGVRFARPVRRLPLVLLAVGGGGIVLASIASSAMHSAYAIRYSTIAVAPALLIVALGLGTIPARRRTAVLAVVAVLGMVGALAAPFQRRTQANQVVAHLHTVPGDVVAFCPDQLGPAVHRLAPDAGRQVVYPNFASPAMVNWVDYKQRIKASHPVAFAKQLLAMAHGHTIYFVFATDYELYSNRCSDVATALAVSRGAPKRELTQDTNLVEHDSLFVYPPAH